MTLASIERDGTMLPLLFGLLQAMDYVRDNGEIEGQGHAGMKES